MDPPWVYYFPGLPAQSEPAKAWLELPRYLTPKPGTTGCTWQWDDVSILSLDWHIIELAVVPWTLGPAFGFRLRVAHLLDLTAWEYVLDPAAFYPNGSTLGRSTIHTYGGSVWRLVLDGRLPPFGPPSGSTPIFPNDCIDEWKWGEPIPNP
jgi:hypothetical protein